MVMTQGGRTRGHTRYDPGEGAGERPGGAWSLGIVILYTAVQAI